MGVTWDDIARWWKSFADASVCCRCGKPIPAGDAVWLIPCQLVTVWEFVSIWDERYAAGCPGCGHEYMGAPHQQDRVRARPCPGCGRVVRLLVAAHGIRSFLCSHRCRNRVYGARFRKWHPRPKAERSLVQCQTCGNNFAPRRAGAKTCSPACRQKAYRRRRGVTDA
jgi:hypothetical protein